MIAVDTERSVRFMKAVAERLTGWSTLDAERAPLRAILRISDPTGDQVATELIERVFTSRMRSPLRREAFVLSREGIRVAVDGGMSCVVDDLGRIVGASITLRDVTDARRAESERRDLEAALLDAVGREQRRFATDLHDGLGQELTGLALLLSALASTARAARNPHASDLERACEVARHALASCRSVARGLSPIAPAEGGLIDALRGLVSRLKGSSGPAVAIAVSELSPLGLSPAASDHLYRIARRRSPCPQACTREHHYGEPRHRPRDRALGDLR